MSKTHPVSIKFRAQAQAKRQFSVATGCSARVSLYFGAGADAVDSNLGWKGLEKHVAMVPQIFDLLSDSQERYDITMNNFTENTWIAPVMGEAVKGLMESYVRYPPRKLQSDSYSGPITITNYQKFEGLRNQRQKDGFKLSLPGH